MRNRFIKSFMLLLMSTIVLSLAAPSLAQWRGSYRTRAYQRGEVERLIRQAENRSDQFAAMVDRMFDQVRWSSPIREEGLSARAHDLERELNIVRQDFFSAGNYYDVRSQVSNA